jgi:hypothetical protein
MSNFGSHQRSTGRERRGLIATVIAVMLVVIVGTVIYTTIERRSVDKMPSAQTSTGTAPKNPTTAPSAPEKVK